MRCFTLGFHTPSFFKCTVLHSGLKFCIQFTLLFFQSQSICNKRKNSEIMVSFGTCIPRMVRLLEHLEDQGQGFIPCIFVDEYFEKKPQVVLGERRKRGDILPKRRDVLPWRTFLCDACLLDLLVLSKGFHHFPQLRFWRAIRLYQPCDRAMVCA